PKKGLLWEERDQSRNHRSFSLRVPRWQVSIISITVAQMDGYTRHDHVGALEIPRRNRAADANQVDVERVMPVTNIQVGIVLLEVLHHADPPDFDSTLCEFLSRRRVALERTQHALIATVRLAPAPIELAIDGGLARFHQVLPNQAALHIQELIVTATVARH